VLITGDSVWNAFNKIRWPFGWQCTDAGLNRRTASVLADADYDIAAFTHGPEIRDQARETVRGWLAERSVTAG
jgi:hypothetical protein